MFKPTLGNSDLTLGPLVLWVHGYENDRADNFYDANWLRVTAHCGAQGASVEVSGSILLTSELQAWCEDLRELHRTMTGTAVLEPMEPNLAVRLKGEALGRLSGEIEISPDPVLQAHRFSFEMDQSYLPQIVSEMGVLLTRWPIRRAP
jgi:hypothetical protein